MTTLPKLPEPDAVLGDSLINIGENHYTEAQMLEYGRRCVEASAKAIEHYGYTEAAKIIRAMLTQGEKT